MPSYTRTLSEATITVSGLTNIPAFSFVDNITITANEKRFDYQDVEAGTEYSSRQSKSYTIRIRHMPIDWNVQKSFDLDDDFSLQIVHTNQNGGSAVTESYSNCRFQSPSDNYNRGDAATQDVTIISNSRTIS